MRPSQQMKLAQSGKLDQCDDAVKSWHRLTIYKEADRVLRLPFDKRKKAIDSSAYPDMLAEEVIRLNKLKTRGQDELF